MKPEKETRKTSNQGIKQKDFLAKEAVETLREEFKNIEGTMYIKYLWTSCDVHRFRVNWWIGPAIVSSKFVHLFTDEKGKVIIRETTNVK